MKKIVNNLMLGSLAAMVLGLALVGCDKVVHEAVTVGRIITGDIEFDFDEAEHQKTEILRAEEERLKEYARIREQMKEKEKMSALAPTDNPAPQPSGPEEAAHYEDEPEQTAVDTEKKHLNIAGRWVGTYIITDHAGPDYGGVTYEYGTNEELVLSVNQAANSDQATVNLWGTECATTFNSESRKLEFTYNTYIEGTLLVAVFKGTVTSDLSAIEGTLVQTWPDGTKFSGTWRVRR